MIMYPGAKSSNFPKNMPVALTHFIIIPMRARVCLAVLCAMVLLHVALACTSIGVGKKATVDGSTLVSHSDDGVTDGRLMYVPSKTHAAGEMRNVYYDTEEYPRFVGTDRGPGYAPQPGQTPSVPIGQIPEMVGRTYARHEGTYAVMNEAGVGIGESTCSAIFTADSVQDGGQALLSVDELSRIGLERCSSARCAVQTMGDLAVQFGFYGADDGLETGAESLIVHDDNEVFVFHILADDTATSAIWVAQRVPDDHVAIVANMFTVRAVNLTDTFNFLGSPNMLTIAQQHGRWDPSQGLLDFTAVFSDGEYAHKYYSGRRMWGGYRLLTDVALPDTYNNLTTDLVYPTTIPITRLLTPQDLMKVHRTFYEGTKYDTTVGMAGGAFGEGDRFPTWGVNVTGNWERTINIYRTTYTHVTQARTPGPNVPALQAGLIWWGPHVTSTTVFIPIAATVNALAPSLSLGDPHTLDRNSIYWAMKYVYNLKRMRYGPMMVDIIKAQSQFESDGRQLVKHIDSASPPLSVTEITDLYSKFVTKLMSSWWTLADQLMVKFADGGDGSTYPNWWLMSPDVGFMNGPPSYPKSALVDGVLPRGHKRR